MPAEFLIWHNPKCSTSRFVLKALKDAGQLVVIRDYLQDPPGKNELEDIMDAAGLTALGLLRKKGPAFAALGPEVAALTDEMALNAMIEDPALIERPLVIVAGHAKLCRPKEAVFDLLNQYADQAASRRPSLESLMAALPEVLSAPKDEAEIRSLCLRPDIGQRQFVESLALTVEQGIPGERWLTAPWRRLADGSPDPDIQVSILPSRVCDLVWQPGDPAPHPGDPIVADLDMSEANLPAGSLIGAGSAVLQVSAVFNTACIKWRSRYGLDAFRWINIDDHPRHRLRGILCAVKTGGEVTLGDRLKVIRRGV